MRWKYKEIISNQKKVFLRRLSFYTKRGSIKLHIITGNDSDVFHTHPWDFTSFILFGGYKEFVKTKDFSSIKDRSMKSMKAVNARKGNRGYITSYLESIYNRRMFSINKKLHNEEHRVELFTLFGYKIPAITIGIYSEKLQLCSFCKEAGRCLANDPKI